MLDVDEFIELIKKNFKKMADRDKARKEKGELVGRYIREPFADGYAYYKITRVNKKSVRIQVVTDIGDDWRIPYWGEETTIPLDYAMQNIRSRDAFATLFSSNK